MAYSAFKLQTASADGKSIRNNITQATHGFVAGDVVRWDVATSGFTGAQANSAINAEVSGVIEKVLSTSQFTLVYQGEIDLSAMEEVNDEMERPEDNTKQDEKIVSLKERIKQDTKHLSTKDMKKKGMI